MVLLRTVHWKVLWGTKTGSFYMASLWKPPFGTFIFKEFSHIVYSYLSSPIWALFSCLLHLPTLLFSCCVVSLLYLSCLSLLILVCSSPLFLSLLSSYLISLLLVSCCFHFTSHLISVSFLLSSHFVSNPLLCFCLISSHPSVLLLVSSHLSFSYFTFILSHHSFLSPLLFYSHFILVCFFFFFFILSHHSFLVSPLLLSSPLVMSQFVCFLLSSGHILSFLISSTLLLYLYFFSSSHLITFLISFSLLYFL